MAVSIPNTTATINTPTNPSRSPLSAEIRESASSQPQQEPHPSECSICNTPIDTIRPDNTTETPSILPCGHIFGSICINRWLEFSQHKNCPNCRREMLYLGCGHTVIPKALPAPFLKAEVDSDSDAILNAESGSKMRLKAVDIEDMPSLCLLCRESREMEEVVRKADRRLAAEERALEGLKVLPGLFGGLYRGSESASGDERVGERSEDARRRWMRDMEILREGLRSRIEGKEEW